jgi:hypothetical protein
VKLRVCWVLVGLLLLLSGGLAYKFIFQGSVGAASDGRTAIYLEQSERDFVLTEMRTFLMSVQQITTGLGKNDMQQVAAAARQVGAATAKQVPGSLMGKLPMGFKRLGMDTHAKFDQMALDAKEMGNRELVLEQLGELMQNCVACHEIYRLDLEVEN